MLLSNTVDVYFLEFTYHCFLRLVKLLSSPNSYLIVVEGFEWPWEVRCSVRCGLAHCFTALCRYIGGYSCERGLFSWTYILDKQFRLLTLFGVPVKCAVRHMRILFFLWETSTHGRWQHDLGVFDYWTLLDYWTQSLSKSNTMFTHKDVHKCMTRTL